MQESIASEKAIVAVEVQRQIDRMVSENIVTTVPLAKIGELSENIHTLMKEHLKEDLHYGKLPGTDKVMLFKAGAELVGMFFQLRPEYEVTVRTFENISSLKNGEFHREYDVKCKLYKYIGMEKYILVSDGEGSCSTLEEKYRYRKGTPIDTGKAVPAGYWDRFNKDKKDGTQTAKQLLGKGEFVKRTDDGTYKVFISAATKEENQNIADLWNTVKKMACKRAFVHAIQQFTASSNIFQADDNDDEEKPEVKSDPQPKPQSKPKVDDAKFVDITGNPTPQNLIDPKWFIAKIEALKDEIEYGIFFKEYKTELSMFSGPDDEAIRIVSLAKKKELYKEKIEKEFGSNGKE